MRIFGSCSAWFSPCLGNACGAVGIGRRAAIPKQAYVFVDDHVVGEARNHDSLKLSPGDHKVELVNYGYTPVTQKVTITGGQTNNLEITL